MHHQGSHCGITGDEDSVHLELINVLESEGDHVWSPPFLRVIDDTLIGGLHSIDEFLPVGCLRITRDSQ